jgi:hypothetical protein
MISKWRGSRPELRSKPSHHEAPAPIVPETQPPALGRARKTAEAVKRPGRGLRSRAFFADCPLVDIQFLRVEFAQRLSNTFAYCPALSGRSVMTTSLHRFIGVICLVIISELQTVDRTYAQQTGSISACRTVCARSASTLLSDSERTLLQQCVGAGQCTTFSDPPTGAAPDYYPPIQSAPNGPPADYGFPSLPCSHMSGYAC